jgi:protein-disulfide isomerase
VNHTPKLSPWLLALLVLTQCARTESVPDTQPTPAAPASAIKPALGADDTAEAAVKVPVDGLPSFGDPHALVTVVAFTDYECPYCAKADASLDQLRDDYGDKLRMVVAMNPLPMHEHAADAARAFLAAVQLGKGEAMHKKLFAMNRAKTVLTEDALRDAARDLGLDVAAFDAARNSDAVKESLTKSLALAARLDVKGTPTFFTNGRRLVGARPMEAFRALFDEELTKASKLGSGDVYAVMMKTAPDAPPPKAEGPETLEHFDVDVAKSPYRGSLSSPITIAFFSDFECPYCVKAEKTLRDLEAQKPGQIRVAYKFRPLPMHAHARDAAKAAIAAEKQNKFWPYHDVLVQHRDALEHDDLVKYAGEVGLDLPRFEKDMADPATEDRIKADEAQANALGARGTPTAFVNGYRLVGAQPLPKWIGVADHALKR